MSTKTKKASDVPVRQLSSVLGLSSEGTVARMNLEEFSILIRKIAFSLFQSVATPEDIPAAGIWGISGDCVLPDGTPMRFGRVICLGGPGSDTCQLFLGYSGQSVAYRYISSNSTPSSVPWIVLNNR